MKLSVIIPFFNEQDNAAPVIREVVEVLRPLPYEFEILAIDDASQDKTLSVLRDLAREVPELRVICHSRNEGQGASWWTGFAQATGDICITLDGDGQNDCQDIPRMLSLLEGTDAVLGQRTRRNDPLSKRVASAIAFFFRHLLLGDKVRDTACSLKVMRRSVLRHFLPVRNFFVFIPFLLKQANVPFRITDVNHRPRVKGRSKYSLSKFYFLPVIADLLFMWWYRRTNTYRIAPLKRG